jgi:hypothetical protein
MLSRAERNRPGIWIDSNDLSDPIVQKNQVISELIVANVPGTDEPVQLFNPRV